MALLKIKPADSSDVQEFQLPDERVSIGRAQDNRIILNDKTASRHHAEIHRGPQGFVVSDTGSANGTWVNRERIEQRILSDGDEIRIAGTTITFSDPPAEAATVLLDVAEYRDQAPGDVGGQREATAPFPAEPAPAPPQAPPPPPVPPRQPQAPPMAVSPPPAASPVVQQQSRPSAPIRTTASKDLAGFGIRLGAYLIDVVILTVIMMIIMVPIGIGAAALAQRSQGAVVALSAVGWFLSLVVCIAYVLVHWARSGATLGKRILRLKVVRDDGVEPLGYGKAALRLVGYMASGAILYIGYLMILFNEEKKGLHDLIAGTKVVRV